MPDMKAVLDLPMPPGNTMRAATVRGYLASVIRIAWDGQAAKYWVEGVVNDVYPVLAQAGHLRNATLYDDGSLDDCDFGHASRLIGEAIAALEQEIADA